jgi:hypothetical protein
MHVVFSRSVGSLARFMHWSPSSATANSSHDASGAAAAASNTTALPGVRLIHDASSSTPLQARVQQQVALWQQQKMQAVFSAWRRQIIQANQKVAAMSAEHDCGVAGYVVRGWRLQACYVGHANEVMRYRR